MEMIGVAGTVGDECDPSWTPMNQYLKLLDGLYDTMFKTLNSISWDSKDEIEYDGKNCTLYQNNENALYVYEDYPYALVKGSVSQFYEWEWEVPLDKFKVESCGGDFAKTPAEKYSNCTYESTPKSSEDAASSTKTFAAVVFGVVAACLVALF